MFFKLFFCVCLARGAFGQLKVDDPCTSKDGVEGVCKTVMLCNPAVTEVRKQEYHTYNRCGFDGLEEIVCCVEDGFGDRTADPTTEPSVSSTPDAKSKNTPFTRRPVLSLAAGGKPAAAAKAPAAAKARPLRKAERECQKIKEMLPPPIDSYILGGNEAALGEFPHMVQVGYVDLSKDKDKDLGIEFLCGGTLISQTHVMSAAHCFVLRLLRQREPVLVRAGVTSLAGNAYNPKTDYNISVIISHPQFDKHSYDIAIIKLKRPVPLSEFAHPGCLYARYDLPSHAIVSGWGIADYENRVYSESLLKVNLTVVPMDKCRELYNSVRLRQAIEDNMLCAGDEKGKDACQGDSGGPLQALTEGDGHYRIIGIVSFGVSCGTTTPGVYSRVFSHLDWIESIVWP